MRKSSRIMVLLLTLALTSGTFEGCKKKDEKKPEDKSDKKVTLQFWENENAKVQKVYDSLIQDFRKQNENIEIKRTHYKREELSEGFKADGEESEKAPQVALVSSDAIGELASAKLVSPVSEFSGSDTSKSLFKQASQISKFKGKEYMVPVFFSNLQLLLYNKKIVAQPPQTFDELISTSKRLQTEKKVKYGLAINTADPTYTLTFLGAFGGKVFEDTSAEKKKFTLDTQAASQWLSYMKGLMAQEIIPKEPDFNSAEEDFKNGSAAFLITDTDSLSSFEDRSVDYGIASLPTINGKYLAPYSTVKGYVVSTAVKEKDKKEGIKKFIEYMNKKENIVKLAEASEKLPANTDAAKSDKIKSNQLLMLQASNLDRSIFVPIMAEFKSIKDSIASVQHDVFLGKIKLEDAPSKMQKKAEESSKSQEKK